MFTPVNDLEIALQKLNIAANKQPEPEKEIANLEKTNSSLKKPDTNATSPTTPPNEMTPKIKRSSKNAPVSPTQEKAAANANPPVKAALPEVDPKELFGDVCKGHQVYPLISPYIGKKPVYFGIFNPPKENNLTGECLAQHRQCLERGIIGAKEPVSFIPNGFKTRVISHGSDKSGDIRIAAVGDKSTVVKNGITYHLVEFNKVYTHKNQAALYDKNGIEKAQTTTQPLAKP